MNRILAQFQPPVISQFGMRRLATAFTVAAGVTPPLLRRASLQALRLFAVPFRNSAFIANQRRRRDRSQPSGVNAGKRKPR